MLEACNCYLLLLLSSLIAAFLIVTHTTRTHNYHTMGQRKIPFEAIAERDGVRDRENERARERANDIEIEFKAFCINYEF